ncbi:MAG TPA: sulfite exporter TauE/SafE family protein [Methylomirabilota bacterium]|nr:sulfite exporter TauE/SafE family protein [Methylomirabilota bacterium]
MTAAWAAGALVVFVASFVMGLTGFGIALVAMAFLPYLMAPADAIVLLTIYALVFSIVVVVQLRRDLAPRALVDLTVGTLAGTPLGVWVLASLPVSALNRLIGAVLVLVVVLEFRRALPERLEGHGWGLGAGFLSGLVGGAVGTPGPPVIVYATTQGWSPRTVKANIMGFFVLNQGATLLGYWWAGLLTPAVLSLTVTLALPAVAGLLAGHALFGRLDPVRFRRAVFALLLVSGLVLLIRG